MKNIFLKRVTQLLVSAVFLCNSLYAITFNGQTIDDTQVEILFSKKNYCVLVDITNGNITTEGTHIKNIIHMLQENLDQNHLQKKYIFRATEFTQTSPTIFYEDAYFRGKEKINFTAQNLSLFSCCMFESPCLSIVSDQITFAGCFLINPKNLYIFPTSPDGDIKSIHIVLHENSAYPSIIEGNIDMYNGINTMSLMATNIKKITIQFSDKYQS